MLFIFYEDRIITFNPPIAGLLPGIPVLLRTYNAPTKGTPNGDIWNISRVWDLNGSTHDLKQQQPPLIFWKS